MSRSGDLSRDRPRALCDALLRAAAPLVPPDVREDWLREWRAEVAWRLLRAGSDRRRRGATVARTLGAWVHAAWLRQDRWRGEMLLQDLKYAVRGLWRRPGFTAVAVLTLAVGIGANAAIFSAAYAVLGRPLPFPESDRLVRLYKTPHRLADTWGGTTTPPDFVDWQHDTRSFTAMGAYVGTSMALTGEGEPAQVPATGVTGGFFPALGVPAALGRTLRPDDDATGGPDVVVLSHHLWQRQFGARSDIVGRRVVLAGISREVVGVMPAGVVYPLGTDVWVPLRFSAETLATQRGAHYLDTIARLRPGVTLSDARADVRAVAARLADAYPRTNADYTGTVAPLRETLVGPVRPALVVALAAVGFVLLMVCVNLASLMLARTAGRARELAVRAAVGADRARLLRGLLVESLVLAAAGGAVGGVVATWAASAIAAAPGLDVPLLDHSRVDGVVAGFIAAVSLVVGLLFGLGPAWQASRVRDTVARLKDASATVTGRSRVRQSLIVAETAMAVVLLVGAGLLVRSLTGMLAVPLGYETSGVQTFAMTMADSRYPDPQSRADFLDRLLERTVAHPEVAAAGAISGLPLTDYHFGFSGSIRDGQPLPDDEQDRLTTQLRVVTAGYFEAMRIRVIEGRAFTRADRAGAPPALVVSESAARLIWPGVSPLGRQFAVGTRLGLGGDRVGGEVVGVVADVRDLGPTTRPRPMIYVAHAQFPVGTMRLAARAVGDPAAIVPFLRETLAAQDPDLPMFQVQTFDQIARVALAQPRLLTLLLSVFAVAAVALAGLGLYGVMAHAVSQRTREIGIRMALGAKRAEVVRLVVGEAGRLGVAGIVLGLPAAAAASRLLGGLLFGVEATDAPTYGAVALLVAAVSLAAAWRPAWRASRVNPVVALRQE